MPVWGKLVKQLVKAAAAGQPPKFGVEAYQPGTDLPNHYHNSKPSNGRAQYLTSDGALHRQDGGGGSSSGSYCITARS